MTLSERPFYKQGQRWSSNLLSDNLYRWRKRHPEKTKAQRAVFVAKRNGSLEQKPCEVCGKRKSEAHHEDYSKPLEVTWLCRKHHQEADAARRKREAVDKTLDMSCM